MDTQATLQSKPQWRYERPHRVRLFTEALPINDAAKMGAKEIYWHCANKFSDTKEYQWVADNNIKLDYMIDDLTFSWHKIIIFYTDLSESEYVDYCLRFFDHHDEAWK